MFGGLLGTAMGKVAAIVVTVGGVAGGLAATGGLPPLGQVEIPTAAVPVAGSAGVAMPVKGGAPLGFPDLPRIHEAIISQGAQDLAASASGRALKAAAQAERDAKKAATSAQKCLDDLTAQVNALAAGIPNITTQQQAAEMVAKAKTIGENATACARQASALGQKGVDEINKTAAQLNAALAQIGSLDLQKTAGQVVQGAQNAVGDAGKTVDQASGSAFGMFQRISDMAAALMATAMEYQNRFQPGTTPVNPAPVPTVPTNPTDPNPFSQWGDFGAWMNFATQMQQAQQEGNTGSWNDDARSSGTDRRDGNRWTGR